MNLEIPIYALTQTTLLDRTQKLHTGAGCQSTTPSCGQGEAFSLDIPFYTTRLSAKIWFKSGVWRSKRAYFR